MADAVAMDATLKDKADTALAALVAGLRPRQAGVVGTQGHYRQCIAGKSWGTWEDQKPDPAALPVVYVHEYLSPQGPGYVIAGEVTDGLGQTWQRAVNVVGPETWRTHRWQQVIQEG